MTNSLSPETLISWDVDLATQMCSDIIIKIILAMKVIIFVFIVVVLLVVIIGRPNITINNYYYGEKRKD